jgi:hypothetical protein
MNRSILIVICDFLLVSLLAFSTVDTSKVADTTAQRNLSPKLGTNTASSDKDLAAVMRLALDEERKNRDQLVGELTRTRETATRQQALLTEREKQVQAFQQEIQTREQKARELQQQVQAREQQTQQLQQEIQAREDRTQQLQQQQTALQQQYASAQANLQSLNQKLQGATTEASMSKERLAQVEAEVRRQVDQSAAMQQQLADLAKSNQLVLAEKQRLSGQLQVAEVERRHATEQVTRMEQEVKTEREEKAKLAEGVKVLATHSGQLAQEIRENRPMAANTIFDEFVTNRVQANFTAARPGLFGETVRNKDTETVLVSDGTNTFALCHVEETPLAFSTPGTEWEMLSGTLVHGPVRCPIGSLSFCWPDPRVVLVPVNVAQVSQLGCKVYRIASTPYKFQDAVLVGAKEGYYGECRFQIDLTTPEYVKLDNSFIKGLFGKFNPSRGDLVFSKQGELLGIMANNNYCLMLQKFDATATFRFGKDMRNQHTGDTLSRLYAFVAGLPSKLQ